MIICKRLLFLLVLLAMLAPVSSFAAVEGEWRLLMPMNFGLGYGTRHPNFDNPDPGSGITIPMDFYEYAVGFESLGQLGIGTKLLEVNDLLVKKETLTSPSSLLPVYLYYPISSSAPEKIVKKLKPVRKKFVYLFAGGSNWGTDNNYKHVGIGWIMSSWDYGEVESYPGQSVAASLADTIIRAFPVMNVSMRAGAYWTTDYKLNGSTYDGSDNGYYLSFTFGLGAAQLRK